MLTQLSTLKSRLGILDTDTTNDALLIDSAKAVSSRFDAECGRTLARTVNHVHEFSAESVEICCPCYPIEAVARFELKTSEATGWVEQSGVEHLIRRQCVISLAAPLGNVRAQGRVVYTGGYVLPGNAVAAGQTPLPVELEQAAVEQVAYWFQKATVASTFFTVKSTTYVDIRCLAWVHIDKIRPSHQPLLTLRKSPSNQALAAYAGLKSTRYTST